MPAAPWSGQLWLGRDYGLIHGELGRTEPHAHYAHQLIIATRQPLTINLDGHLHTAHQLFIPALSSHAIIDAPGVVFTVYAEPLRLAANVLQSAVRGAERSLAGLDQALRQCPRQPIPDSRVERALDALDVALTGKVSALTLAAQAHVSLSQLERLFACQVGLPVRRLVLWRRLRLAMALVLAGKPVTDAAHGAGFADSAHFSRTLKALFGVTARQALRGIELRLLP